MINRLFALTCLLWLCSLPILSIAQVNSYFDNDPVWRIDKSCSWSFPCVEAEDYFYYTSGDTLINGLEFVRIVKSGTGNYLWFDTPPDNGCNGNYTIAENPSFYLRSENKKIFIHFGDEAEAELLYDFNLEVGDELPMTFNNDSPAIWVDAIDSVLIEGVYYKRFHLNSFATPATYMVEGVGANTGLVEPIGLTLECGFNLSCYGQNGNTYLPTPTFDCELITSTSVGLSAPEINIFPHPLVATSRVEIGSVSGLLTFTIQDMTGKVVRRFSATSGSIFLHRDGLAQGLYMISVSQDSRRIASNKLVVGQ